MCTPKPVAPNLCHRKHPGTHPTMRGRSGLHWGCLGKGGELDWFRWTGQLQGEACKAQCSAAEGICFLLYSEGGTSVTDSGLGTISLGDNRPGRAHGRRRRRRDAGDGAGGARCGGVGGGRSHVGAGQPGLRARRGEPGPAQGHTRFCALGMWSMLSQHARPCLDAVPGLSPTSWGKARAPGEAGRRHGGLGRASAERSARSPVPPPERPAPAPPRGVTGPRPELASPAGRG